jgi:hypothetical protein
MQGKWLPRSSAVSHSSEGSQKHVWHLINCDCVRSYGDRRVCAADGMGDTQAEARRKVGEGRDHEATAGPLGAGSGPAGSDRSTNASCCFEANALADRDEAGEHPSQSQRENYSASPVESPVTPRDQVHAPTVSVSSAETHDPARSTLAPRNNHKGNYEPTDCQGQFPFFPFAAPVRRLHLFRGCFRIRSEPQNIRPTWKKNLAWP